MSDRGRVLANGAAHGRLLLLLVIVWRAVLAGVRFVLLLRWMVTVHWVLLVVLRVLRAIVRVRVIVIWWPKPLIWVWLTILPPDSIQTPLCPQTVRLSHISPTERTRLGLSLHDSKQYLDPGLDACVAEMMITTINRSLWISKTSTVTFLCIQIEHSSGFYFFSLWLFERLRINIFNFYFEIKLYTIWLSVINWIISLYFNIKGKQLKD